MHQKTDILKHWLAAENAGRDAAAERALGALFSRLPQASPAADFADRVLAAVVAGTPARASHRRGADATLAWWSRAAIAACLLLVGLAAALILPLVVSLVRIVDPGAAASALVQGFVALASRIDELLSLWQVWARIVETTLLVATAPPVVLSLLTLTALSAFTFRGLKRALVPHRSPDHVPA